MIVFEVWKKLEESSVESGTQNALEAVCACAFEGRTRCKAVRASHYASYLRATPFNNDRELRVNPLKVHCRPKQSCF